MDIRTQMEISALLGIPLADLLNKTEDFIVKVHRLVRKETENPRQAVILMAIAYLYHVELTVKPGADILAESQTAIIAAVALLGSLTKQESSL